MAASLLRYALALLLAVAPSLAIAADTKESALSTVAPGVTDTVTGLQGGANVNFTTQAIANLFRNASLINTGTLPAAQLPNPSAGALGGVQSKAAASHAYLTAISTSGVVSAAVPVCADLSDAGTGCTTTVGTSATVNTGTSGATIPLLNGNLTFSGNDIFSGTLKFSGLSAGTQVSCLGLDSGNFVVLLASACGGGSGTPGGSSGQVQYNNAGAFGGFTFSGDMTLVASTGVATAKYLLTEVANSSFPYQITATDRVIVLGTVASPYNAANTITLPASAGKTSGDSVTITDGIYKTVSAVIPLTIAGNGSDTVNGITSLTGAGAQATCTLDKTPSPPVWSCLGSILPGASATLYMGQGTGTPNFVLITGDTTINNLGVTSTLKVANITYPTVWAQGTILNASAGNTLVATRTPTLGLAGTLGTLGFGNATSGTVTLQPATGALGSAVLTMPGVTDTLAVLGTAQTFTAKQTLTGSGPLELGAASGNVGSIKIIGNTSGSATISVAAAAGTPNTLLLPTATGTNGFFLKTDGGTPQQLSWAAASGGIGCTTSGSAGQLLKDDGLGGCASLADATFATGTLSLGVNTSERGAVKMFGNTSGDLTIRPASVAGTASVLTFPGATFDFSASGGASQVVKQTSSGGAFSVARLACADLSDSAATCSSAAASGLTGQVAKANGGTAATTGAGASTNLSLGYALCDNGAAATAPISAHTGDTAETVLFACKVPANTMGANGILRLSFRGTFTTGNTNSKAYKTRFGTGNNISGTQCLSASTTTSGQSEYNVRYHAVANVAATNVQLCDINTSLGFGNNTAPAAIDTTSDAYLVITGQLGSAGDSIGVQFAKVELIPGAGN